jgi:hypothetical protein
MIFALAGNLATPVLRVPIAMAGAEPPAERFPLLTARLNCATSCSTASAFKSTSGCGCGPPARAVSQS